MPARSFDTVGSNYTWKANPLGIHVPVADAVAFDAIQITAAPEGRAPNMVLIAELAGSIRASGLLQRIVVERDPPRGYRIVAGWHRMKAIQLIGSDVIPQIPVVRFEPLTDAQREYLRKAENFYRAELTPAERAEHKEACLRLELGEKAAKRTPRQEAERTKKQAQRGQPAAPALDCPQPTPALGEGEQTLSRDNNSPLLHGWKGPAADAAEWSNASLERHADEIHQEAGVERRKSGKYPAEDVAKLAGAAMRVKARKAAPTPRKAPAKPRAPKVQAPVHEAPVAPEPPVPEAPPVLPETSTQDCEEKLRVLRSYCEKLSARITGLEAENAALRAELAQLKA